MSDAFRITNGKGKEITPIKTFEDKRLLVEGMFFDWDELKGKKVALPIIAIDCTDGLPGQQGVRFKDQIPILQNYLTNLEDIPAADQGHDLLMLGGTRFGKKNLGRIMVPVEQVKEFCGFVKEIAELYKESQNA